MIQSKPTGQLVLFLVALALVVGVLGSIPSALNSILGDIRHPDHEFLEITPKDLSPAGTYSRLEVAVFEVDEVAHTVSMLISGYHFCAEDCADYTDRIVFYQIDLNDSKSNSMPSSESVTLPHSGAEISAKITLPLRGSVLTYPFDSYHIGLGVVIERTKADKKTKVLTPEETKGQLLITLDEQIARLHMTDLRVIDPKTVKPAKAEFEYANAVIMNFERPVFLKIVVTILVLLTVMVALYTMVTQPFDQLVLNAGAVILGIFGARSLVLSGFPSDVTLIDTIFSIVVLYNLTVLIFRGMNHFHRTGNLNILPWAKAEPEKPKTIACPECLSKIPAAAKRCSFCTSVLPPK